MRHQEEDMKHIKDLVMLRLTQAYPDKEQKEEKEAKVTNTKEKLKNLEEEVTTLKIQLEKVLREKKALEEQLAEKGSKGIISSLKKKF